MSNILRKLDILEGELTFPRHRCKISPVMEAVIKAADLPEALK